MSSSIGTPQFAKDLLYLPRFIRTLKLEGIAQAALMATLIYKSGDSLLFLAYTFLLFDASMLGYFFSPKIGAFLYNLGHTSIYPTLLLIIGILTESDTAKLWSYSWLFHIGVDRSLGYGLKHSTSFAHTHLGIIGKK